MAEYTVDDSVLARRILTFMGRATTSSLEPGADQFADRLATKLAEWRARAAAAQSSPAPASMMSAKEFFAEARRLGCKLPDALSLAAAPTLEAMDAARYRWLRDKSEPGICSFYLSVGQAFKSVKFAPETVDEAIDAAIQHKSQP